jgi:hypothetical protein
VGRFEAKIARELMAQRKLRKQLRVLVEEAPPGRLTRAALVDEIRRRRDAWEAITKRNQDLSDERLADESMAQLRGHLAWYCSEEARAIVAAWLVEIMQHMRR